ncbi:MAG: hypothetical protein AAB410_00815 [Patescibacteria group bacterium]
MPVDKERSCIYRLLQSARRHRVRLSEFRTEFQVALGYPGTELEDEIAASITKFSKRASGICTPVRAEETGLVPSGYTVESDDLEGDIDIANLDFDTCPVREGDGDWVSGDTMMARAKQVKAIGSLGFGKLVLDKQKEGKDIIPVELRGKVYILLTRTVLRRRSGSRCVLYLRWDGKRWVVDVYWLDVYFYRYVRFVRSRELR